VDWEAESDHGEQREESKANAELARFPAGRAPARGAGRQSAGQGRGSRAPGSLRRASSEPVR